MLTMTLPSYFFATFTILDFVLSQTAPISIGTIPLSTGAAPSSMGNAPSGFSTYSSPSSLSWSYPWKSATVAVPSSGMNPGEPATSDHSSLRSLSLSSLPLGTEQLSSAVGSSGSSTILSSPSSGTGQFHTIAQSSASSLIQADGTSVSPSPGSTVGASGPSTTPMSATSSPALATTLAPVPSVTLPPSGISIAPSGTTASSDGVVFGGLLFALSANIHGVDLTIPTIKAEVIQDVENIINRADNLFNDLGGTDIKGSCESSSKSKRLSKPFTGLENLAGDITKVIGCADEVLNSLKDRLNEDTPDPDLIDDLLGDLGTLAGETDPNDEPSKSASNSIASQTTSADSNFSPSSTTSSSASSGSSSSSSAASGCTSCCPTDVPALPTDGTPAVTAAPTNFDTLDKRVIPERFQLVGRMGKRARPSVPIPKINNCVLRTPAPWPVTIPAYPGGFELYTSDKNGQLGPLTTISRYYRSTTAGAPACTPTITKINADQWTFPQSGQGIPENDKVSCDHAYEIGFLRSFMEDIIDKPNGVTCSIANTQFFDTGTCPDNRLQPIFASLPSYTNPEFVAMSQWLNGDAKGWVSDAMPAKLQTATDAIGHITRYTDITLRFSGQLTILIWADLSHLAQRCDHLTVGHKLPKRLRTK